MALVVPEDFSRRLGRGDASALQVILDGSDANTATIVQNYVSLITARFMAGLLERAAGIVAGRLNFFEPRIWYNPELRSSFWMVPGVLSLVLLISTLVLTAMAITNVIEWPTMWAKVNPDMMQDNVRVQNNPTFAGRPAAAGVSSWGHSVNVSSKNKAMAWKFVDYLTNSLVVATVAALACVLLAVAIGHTLRLGGGRLVRGAAQMTTFGYAVPGAVVGIGVLIAFARFDELLEGLGVPGGTGLLVTGSVMGILYAYVVRFLAPAYQAVDASFAKIPPSMTMSAMSLGATPRRILTRVHLPLVRPGVAVALVLVAIDAVKELPIVLLLRPFGFTTVSVWVYELARENFWEKAALPALVIVAVAVVPVVFLFRQVRRVELRGRSE